MSGGSMLLLAGQPPPPPSPAMASSSLSPWDAELNVHYRGLLELPMVVNTTGLRSAPSSVVHNASSCASLCSGHGLCLPVRTGVRAVWSMRCACRPGWVGERCESRDASPCNTPEGGRVLTRCAGSCDNDVNRCTCGAASRFPRRPMVHCRYQGVERDMPWQTPAWANFANAPKKSFWSAGGGKPVQNNRRHALVSWCDADPDLQQRTPIRCKCYDGQDPERLCEPVAPRSTDATFCPNQCHFRGECESGFCW